MTVYVLYTYVLSLVGLQDLEWHIYTYVTVINRQYNDIGQYHNLRSSMTLTLLRDFLVVPGISAYTRAIPKKKTIY